MTDVQSLSGPDVAVSVADGTAIEKQITSNTLPRERRDAFISYSHGASGEMAQSLQNSLQRFAKPWWRRRSLNVFRDETDLSVYPALWDSIVVNLDASDWLVLIASPQAAQSKWVKREVRHWLGEADVHLKPLEELDQPLDRPDSERAARIIFVLASGKVAWRDGMAADFDWTTTDALPRCLVGVFAKEPLWIDLSDVVEAGSQRSDLDRRNSRFISAAARIYSRIKTIDLATLIGEDAREHRRTMRTAWSAATALGMLAIAATIAAWLAFLAAAAADKQRQIAEADRQAGLAQNLTVRSPNRLPEAGAIARTAYASMRSLSATSTAPAWLIDLLQKTGMDQWGMLSQIVEANRYRASFDRVQPAVDVMRTVEQLLPALRSRPGSFGTENSHHLSFLDGGVLASRNSENSVQLWTAVNGAFRSITLFDTPAYRSNGSPNTAFSGNGRIVASESGSDGFVRIRNLSDGSILRAIDPRSVFNAPDFIPPPRRSAPSGAPMTETFTAGGRNSNPLLAGVALSGDGKRILLITRGGKARLFSTFDQSVAPASTTLSVPDSMDFDRLSTIVLDPAAEKAALTSSSNIIGQVPVAVLQTADGTALFPPLLHGSSVNAVAFSPDGKRLATGTDDGGVFFWDARTGARERAFNAGVAAQSLAFGVDNSEHVLLVGTREGLAKGYDLVTGHEIFRAPHPGRIDAVAWNMDGRQFATGAVSVAGQKVDPVRVWSIDELTNVSVSRMQTESSVDQIAISSNRIAAIVWPSSLFIWDERTGQLVRKFEKADVARLPFAFDATGNYVATIAKEEDGLAYGFDIGKADKTRMPGPGLTPVAIEGRESHLADAAFDRGGKRLARVIHGVRRPLCRIEMWIVGNAKPSDQVDCTGSVAGIAIDNAGEQIAWIETGPVPRVFLRDLPGKSPRWAVDFPFELSTFVGRRIMFNASGSRLIVGGKRSAMVFDALEGKTALLIKDVGGDIIHAAINADGTRLAVASPDRIVRIFDAKTGELLQLLPYNTDTFGHGGLLFSEDGKRLIAAFGDRNANNPRIWQWQADPDVLSQALSERLAPFVAAGQ